MNQNGVVCLPGPTLLFFIFRFEYLISGPKSFRDVREMGPWSQLFKRWVRLSIGKCICLSIMLIHVIVIYLVDKA